MGSYLPSSALSHISYISHADLSVHSSLLNHSSSSPAHHERRPLRQAEEQPEGFTDTNSASLKAWPAVYITPFTLLLKGLKTELMDSTCPDVIDIDTWAIAMFTVLSTTFLQCAYNSNILLKTDNPAW